MNIAGVDSFLINIPQKYPIAPYQSQYRVTESTQKLLIRLVTDSGTTGWGEAPENYPAKPFDRHEAVGLRDRLIGRDATAIEAMYAEWNLGGGRLQSAVEMAMWDILGKLCNAPLYRLLGGMVRQQVELAACMGIRPPEQAAEIAKLYVEMGFSTLKTKAGRDPQEDLDFVRAIREAVGDRLRLRIDPNTSYTPEVCLQLALDLEPYDLEYFEQPMGADLIEESARIRKLTKTPLALNESVTTVAVVRQILQCDAAAVLLPDTYQCGGIKGTKLVADVASSAGVPCVMHCAHDLGLKTAAMLHLVASTPNFPLANDCTYYGLMDDILVEPFTIERGQMRVPDGPGLGVEVDMAKVRKYQVAASC